MADPLSYAKKQKIGVELKQRLDNKEDFTTAYTPGVGEVSRFLAEHPDQMDKYTSKRNFLAVVSDGTAVLGLGNVGPVAAYPVMEGKAMIFKKCANIDAIPVVIDSSNADVVDVVKAIAPNFAAINLEDIAAPRCFEIEEQLKKALDIPIMHDDQHATAIVVLSALLLALDFVEKGRDVKIVLNGAGAAGIGIAKLLVKYGFTNITMLDSKGVITKEREDLNPYKREVVSLMNTDAEPHTPLCEAIKDADVFIGVSKAGLLTKEDVMAMANNAIVFALANPVPEIMPDEAKKGGAAIVATGRSDLPNQINNALVFPVVFRVAIDLGLQIDDELKIRAAECLYSYAKPRANPHQLLPFIWDMDVHKHLIHCLTNINK